MEIETANEKKLVSRQQLVTGKVYRGYDSKGIYLCIENRDLVNLGTAVLVSYEALTQRPVFEEVKAKVVVDG